MKMNALISTLLLVLCSLTALSPKISVAKASGSIYIRADGNVDPSDAPIQRDYDLYILTADLFSDFGANGIVIERNNMILDGAGHKIESQGYITHYPYHISYNKGIDLVGKTNVTIRNIEIANFFYSIVLDGSSNVTISGNNLANSKRENIARARDCGIFLRNSSSSNLISENSITTSDIGISLDSSDNNNIFRNNLIENYHGVVLEHSCGNDICQNNIKKSGDYSIHLQHFSNNNSISRNNITSTLNGIILDSSYGNVLRDNSILRNYALAVHGSSLMEFVNDVDASNTAGGKPIYYWINEHDKKVPLDAAYVCLVNCSGITVQNLSFWAENILLAYTTDSIITQNYITRNHLYSIYLCSSRNNSISRNNITQNARGIILEQSCNNTIYENNLTNNYQSIILEHSSDNKFYYNNIINNDPNSASARVQSVNSTNAWDDGSEGNYWSDYDGDGSIPYIIDANNQDHHPLTTLYGGQNEPTSLVPAIAIAAVIGAVGGGLLVYFGKVKKKTQKEMNTEKKE